MKLNEFFIREVDLILLFVMGFGFFIACFNPHLALGYELSLFFGITFLSISNYLNSKKEVKQNGNTRLYEDRDRN
jgi:hypothetical protein